MFQTWLLLLTFACGPLFLTDEPAAKSPVLPRELSPTQIRGAIQKAIPLLQQGASLSANERKCFTCHNQALPVIALTEFARQGFDVDRQILQRQLQHTWNHLESGKTEYLAGNGQGGQVMTAGYAMWALDVADWKADETTAAVTHYLVDYQKDKSRWLSSSQRLPSMGSSFTATYVALRALSHYGTEEQSDGIQDRREAAAKWILENGANDTEDRVFRLRTLPYINAEELAIQKDVNALLAQQQADGGWSQTDGMASDAYATGTVLTALQEVGRLACDHPAVVSGCRYLIDSQLEDGTWHVVTRAKPIQTYYESGFPHGADQFISITATAWATLALAGTLPEPKADVNRN